MKRANLKSQRAAETLRAFNSIQSLDESECRLAFDSFQAMAFDSFERDGPAINHADVITVQALIMRLKEFESHNLPMDVTLERSAANHQACLKGSGEFSGLRSISLP